MANKYHSKQGVTLAEIYKDKNSTTRKTYPTVGDTVAKLKKKYFTKEKK